MSYDLYDTTRTAANEIGCTIQDLLLMAVGTLLDPSETCPDWKKLHPALREPYLKGTLVTIEQNRESYAGKDLENGGRFHQVDENTFVIRSPESRTVKKPVTKSNL